MDLAKKQKYFTCLWGCQMNERDQEIIEDILEGMGFRKSHSESDANIIILITCCVREKAENKVFTKLGELAKLKKDNPGLIIGVCGCMVQQKHILHRLKSRFPQVDLVFGTHNLHRIQELLSRVIGKNNQRIFEVWDEWDREEKKNFEDIGFERRNYLKSKVIISYGCNNFCSYCIVPYVRGRERSRFPENIINEIEFLAKKGCKEILLLGQNVNSYGRDLDKNIDFASLLNKIVKVDGIKRIRFMTSHPKDFSDNLIQAIAENDKVCNHIHLPIQAGSNKILKMMRRGYGTEDYMELVGKIRKSIPYVALTTDIIVGFPGETDEDFDDTLNLINTVEYDSAYTFIYSTRSGTRAE